MATIDPSLQRYRSLKQRFNQYPKNFDGTRMNTEHMKAAELGGTIPSGSSTDDDPNTPDIIHLSTEQGKKGFRSETFVELPAPRGLFGRRKGNGTLVHLSRRVNHVPSGTGLSDVALRTVDLVTGEAISEFKGDKALKEAQNLKKQIPFRLHHIADEKYGPGEENWLIR